MKNLVFLFAFLCVFGYARKAEASCPIFGNLPIASYDCTDYGTPSGTYQITAAPTQNQDGSVNLSAPLQLGLKNGNLADYGASKTASGNAFVSNVRAMWLPGQTGTECFWNLPAGGTYYELCKPGQHLLVVFFPGGQFNLSP